MAKILGGEAPTDPVGNLQAYFDAAMARFLQERQVRSTRPNRGETRGRQESRLASTRSGPSKEVQAQIQLIMSDVEMESVGSREYDLDDLDLVESQRGWPMPQWERYSTWSLASSLLQLRTSKSQWSIPRQGRGTQLGDDSEDGLRKGLSTGKRKLSCL